MIRPSYKLNSVAKSLSIFITSSAYIITKIIITKMQIITKI